MNIEDMEGLDEETRKKIEELLEVVCNGDAKESTRAKLDIGIALAQSNDIKSALSVWSSIKRADDPNVYSYAKLNMGIALVQSNDAKSALSEWNKIQRTDNSSAYAQAQLNIGAALEREGDSKGALLAWDSISHADDSEIYSQAQFNIGIELYKNDTKEKGLSVLQDIKNLDNSKVYAKVQYIVGLELKSEGHFERALRSLCNIAYSTDPKIYAQAQYRIGQYLINDSISKKYTEAQKAFLNAKEVYPYETYNYKKVCKLLKNSETETIGMKVLQLLSNTLEIVNALKLDFGNLSKEEKPPERKLAHYTSTEVANILLNEENKKKQAGYLRLNTISNMNDPSEGLLLRSFLDKNKALTYNSSEFDERSHAFFSCFTFNHDSLNQFRLYGKKNFQEASGVSFVFNKEFFQSDNLLGGLTYLFFYERTDNIYDDGSKIQQKNADLKSIESNKDKKVINKQSVMRCIYIDPASDYIQLAQRNRLTFHREFKVSENPEQKWQEYKKAIDKLTTKIAELLNILKKDYQDIRDEYKEFFKENLELIDKILLPLKYLIKHSAFQEEQECRMIYITSLSDKKVQIVYGDFLYVEYGSNVKNYLNKVYIAPAATQYQPYLAKLLCDTDVKIELSNNPYRQT
ncbi:hypothetical protein [Psychrobacter sp. UBA2769]|uniref:hypothetical protein n=1 Tax=Psychrobacter sp. UBA2769 TaxID=1947348 RepID=UPI0025E162AD|nr:hypothetical protein [Psychrobacter sp. UBA2769]